MVPEPDMLTATDNCREIPSVDFIEVSEPGGCPDEETLRRIWTAIDSCLNDTEHEQEVEDVDHAVQVSVPPRRMLTEL